MSLPDRTQALKLDTGLNGEPFVRVSAGEAASSPDIGYLGVPFLAAAAPALPPGTPGTGRRRPFFLTS